METNFTIAIVIQDEKVAGCGAGAGPGSPAALRPHQDGQGEEMGQEVRGAPINLYAKKKKQTSARLGLYIQQVQKFCT